MAIGLPSSRFSWHRIWGLHQTLLVTGEEAGMSQIRKPWGLLRRMVPQRSVERLPDPADMGTAFGLDFCLSERDPGADDVAGELIEGPDALLRRMFRTPAPRG
jgi:hypothetical protein